MTDRATGRHRATHRCSTPLSTLTGPLSVVGGYVGTSVRRSGVIIAMSSGLVASMALPAHATDSQPEAVGPVTASIPVIPANGAGTALFTAPAGGMLALPADLLDEDETVAAPAAATVDFDRSAFSVDDDSGDSGSRDDSDDDGDDEAEDRADDADLDAAKSLPPKRRDLRLSNSASQRAASRSLTAKAAKTGLTASSDFESDSDSDSESTNVVSHGSKAVAVAYRYQGTPYLWGGNSPRGFDCSGFTKYVYSQLGKQLGRTVAAQRGDVKFVKRSQAKPGDLVFMGNGHVGIYLGNNQMIDAPRRGKTIQPRKIYTSNVQFGTVV
ncbi:MAG: peptidoglycan DL-endopeptidase CwlO [Actinomycetota bacterium]|nr:peptidoglycan DL-endopeptidase CwlO [Actinomycetota bacterium]